MWHILDSQVPEPFRTLKSIMGLEGELVTQAKNRDLIRFQYAGKTYYIKRYTSAGKGLRAYVGRSRVRAEWENLQYFWHLHIPAPKLVAYGEERSLFHGYESGAYVMHAIPNTAPLDSIKQYPQLLEDNTWRIEILKQVAQYLKIIHDEGFVHGDLYWRNILFSLNEKPMVYFIDCPQGRHYFGPQLVYQKIRDLVCLMKDIRAYLSGTDMLRFFLAYRGHDKLTDEDKLIIRKLFHRISRKP